MRTEPVLYRHPFWWGQVNSRPLSLFRLGFALVILRDALLHLPIAALFYSDQGVVPRTALGPLLEGIYPWRLSLMAGLGEPGQARLFFGLWAGVAVCLLVGIGTQYAAAINYLFVLSVYWRNPFITSGADDILRVLSFWIIFIPLNHHFSLDNYLRQRQGRPFPETSFALPVRLAQIQIALIYLMAGLFKLLGHQWTDGTAMFYVLQLHSLLLPTGQWLAAHTPAGLLALVTYSVVLLELAFPVLVFTPLYQPTPRRLALLAVFLLHLSIALVMHKPLFDFWLVLGVSYILFAAQSVTTVPPSSPQRPSPMPVVALAGMVLVIWHNLDQFHSYHVPLVPPLPTTLQAVMTYTGLQQGWDLFAPIPYQEDWTLIVPGTFAHQSPFDLRTGEPVQNAIQAPPPGEPYRWKRLEQILALYRPAPLLSAWSSYLCREASPDLLSLQIRLLHRQAHSPSAPPNPLHNELIWLHTCP